MRLRQPEKQREFFQDYTVETKEPAPFAQQMLERVRTQVASQEDDETPTGCRRAGAGDQGALPTPTRRARQR